jgi:hypothetical protein
MWEPEMSYGEQELLNEYSPEVQQLALAMRVRLRELTPDAQETVMKGYNSFNYSFGGGMRDRFLAIVLHRAHVNLQFFNGVDLPDPAGLLEGTGKKLRHVKIRTMETIQRPEVKDLIEAAAALSKA